MLPPTHVQASTHTHTHTQVSYLSVSSSSNRASDKHLSSLGRSWLLLKVLACFSWQLSSCALACQVSLPRVCGCYSLRLLYYYQCIHHPFHVVAEVTTKTGKRCMSSFKMSVSVLLIWWQQIRCKCHPQQEGLSHDHCITTSQSPGTAVCATAVDASGVVSQVDTCFKTGL